MCSAARERNSSRLGRMRRSLIRRTCGRSTRRPRVARAVALLLHHEQQGVGVAVVEGLAYVLTITAGITLAPRLLAATTPVDHPSLVQGHLQRVGVHPRHHQHGLGLDVLGNRQHQTVGVVLDRGELFCRCVDGGAGRHRATCYGARHAASPRDTTRCWPRCGWRRRRGCRARAA